MSQLESRDADLEADCSDCPPSSSASEDVIDIAEADISLPRLQTAVLALLHGIGEDASREGLQNTPRRVAKAWVVATEGYKQTVRSVLGGALFHNSICSGRDNSIVIVRDVDFASTSERTLLPFFGRCHIAYVPRNGVVLGLSKVARLAKMFSRRLQNQQQFTHQLLEAFNAEVQPLGCAAIVEACHLGSASATSLTTASALGCFYERPAVFMQEFVMLLGSSGLSASSVATALGGDRSDQPDCSCCAAPSRGSKAGATNATRQEEETMVEAVESILREVGEDPSREGLQGSAQRYVQHLLSCTPYSPPETDSLARGSISAEPSHTQHPAAVDSLHLSFTSQCEHHLLPFHGAVQVLCLPGSSGRRLSRSDADTVVRAFSRRLQIQERLTHQIAEALHAQLGAGGTIVLCRAAHMCMVARGVEKHASSTVTVAACGAFEADYALRVQALQRLRSELSDNSWLTCDTAA